MAANRHEAAVCLTAICDRHLDLLSQHQEVVRLEDVGQCNNCCIRDQGRRGFRSYTMTSKLPSRLPRTRTTTRRRLQAAGRGDTKTDDVGRQQTFQPVTPDKDAEERVDCASQTCWTDSRVQTSLTSLSQPLRPPAPCPVTCIAAAPSPGPRQAPSSPDPSPPDLSTSPGLPSMSSAHVPAKVSKKKGSAVSRRGRKCRRAAASQGVQTTAVGVNSPGRMDNDVHVVSAEVNDMRELSMDAPQLDRSDQTVTPSQAKQRKLNVNVNYNARRRRLRTLCARRPGVYRKRRAAGGASQVVNVSSLEPISAKCSPSGQGLVVTYRPVFTKSIYQARNTRSRTRTKTAAKKQACMPTRQSANNNQQQVSHRDTGTSPRTPSPKKRRRSDGAENIQHEASPTRGETKLEKEKRQCVSDWLLNKIPFTTKSPRVTTSRSPSPVRGNRPRASPLPGPSWAEDELIASPPTSQQKRPYHRNKSRPRSSSAERSPYGSRPADRAAKRAGLRVVKHPSGRHGPTSRSASPQTLTPKRKSPDAGEGWSDNQRPSPRPRDSSPRGRAVVPPSSPRRRRQTRATTTPSSSTVGRDVSDPWDEEMHVTRTRSSPRTEAFIPTGGRQSRYDKATSVSPARFGQQELYDPRSRSHSPRRSFTPSRSDADYDSRRRHGHSRRHRRHHGNDSESKAAEHENLCVLM